MLASPDPSSADAGKDAASKARRQSEGAPAPLIPNCCNPWVMLRAAGIVQVGMVICALIASAGIARFPDQLLRMALVVEPALFVSLGLLCMCGKWINGWPLRRQWAAGIGLPAAVSFVFSLIVHLSQPTGGASGPTYAVLVHTLTGAVVAGAIIEYFRLRARAYAPSFSEARLQALQARIRPHFLFNSLNTVLGLIRTEPRRAEATLENLADLFRVFMRDAREQVPLDDEIITCKEYLAIEKLRLGERLRVEWHLDEMPGDGLVPSLLLQPLLENAVHHGIEPRMTEGTLVIRITHPNDRVRVEIDNPVSATPPTRPGNQMALSNVRERLMLLYDKDASLSAGVDGDRYRLLLELPYRKERRRRDVRRNFNPDR